MWAGGEPRLQHLGEGILWSVALSVGCVAAVQAIRLSQGWKETLMGVVLLGIQSVFLFLFMFMVATVGARL